MKRAITILLSLAITISLLTGCNEKKDGGTSETSLKLMMMGSKPNKIDDVLGEFYKKTGNTLNIKLDFTWLPMADYKEKLKLKMSAGEEYDLVFDAPWMHLNNHATDKVYQAIESYFDSPEYPALKKNFPADVLESNYMFGHLYAMPVMRTLGNGIYAVNYRQDLADKYGVGTIDNYNKLQQYLEAIKTNEPKMIPIGLLGSRGFFTMWEVDPVTGLEHNVVAQTAANVQFKVLLSDDLKSVNAIAATGDPDSAYAAFPAPINRDLGNDRLVTIREWNKYAEKDSINQKDSEALFLAGKSAAEINGVDKYEQYSETLARNNPGAKLGVFVYNERMRNLEKGATLSNFVANNFVAIPATSRKIEKTMKFLNWLFESKDNHDLFELGIKGIHWNDEGDGLYSVPDGIDTTLNYNYPAYTLTWNSNMVRFNTAIPPEILKYRKYELDREVFIKNPLASFTFNHESVKTQAAKIKPIMDEVETPLKNGILDDPIKVRQQNTAKMRQNGLNDIEAELVKQLNEFLKK